MSTETYFFFAVAIFFTLSTRVSRKSPGGSNIIDISYIYLSLALLVAILSLAGSLTFLVTYPEDQENALRLFYTCWVALSGAVLWLVASVLVIKIVQERSKCRNSNNIGDSSRNTSQQRLFENGQSVPTIGGPVAGSFIHFQAEPSSSMPSIISSNPSTPETPTPRPLGSSRFSSQIQLSPQLPDLPSIFSPFQFHPPDDEALYPQQSSRSDSIIALISPHKTPPKIFDIALSNTKNIFSAESQQPRTPVSPCSSMASGTQSRDHDHDPFILDHDSPMKVTTSPLSQRSAVSRGSIPEVVGVGWSSPDDGGGLSLSGAGEGEGQGDWYRCHLRDGGRGHYLSGATI